MTNPLQEPGTIPPKKHPMKHTKTHALILVAAAIAAVMGFGSCTNPAILKINTPAVQAQILGDVERDLLAGGGALLISGGSTSAAVTAITAQEMKNLPTLQKALLSAKAPVGNITP